MAADALAVVGVDITTGHCFSTLYLEHGNLRAIHYAVVAFKAQAAAHAALGFSYNILVVQAIQAFLEIARNNIQRCIVINAARPEDELEAEIWMAVSRRFPELGAPQ